MALPDVGRAFTQTLTDGRTVSARLSFGDFPRAEMARNTNFLNAIVNDGNVSLSDLAMLCYQAATRTKQYAGTFDDWLREIDGFPDIELPDEVEPAANGDGTPAEATSVTPFPATRSATS